MRSPFAPTRVCRCRALLLAAACWLWCNALSLRVCAQGERELGGDPSSDAGSEEYFERFVRPLLVEKCSGCHGRDEQSGGLRVDTRDGLLAGGDHGPAIVPHAAAQSLMLQAVRRQAGLEMPPDEPLSAEQIALLENWIKAGAAWPAGSLPLGVVDASARETHWAFQPVREPAVPDVSTIAGGIGWTKTPVDAFVLRKLDEHQLAPAPTADRRTLIRRVTYALTGLPPSPAAVDQFVNDPAADAYEALVERLLASREYGEHWGRRWLDLARYADTKGYVYAREERFWVHAWTYRDWVVQALNDDMPYDRFLLLQLAADQVAERREDLAAMGFLTLGRRFLGVARDIIDDRIDVVCRGTMGLTVACARCHDHKYDPIPTEDYYSLYGVFDSCMEQLTPLREAWDDSDFAAELATRKQALADKLAEARRIGAERARQRVADYLFAQSELHKYPPAGFDQIFSANDLLPTVVHRWEAYLRELARGDHSSDAHDPVFGIWRAYAELPAEKFKDLSPAITASLTEKSSEFNSYILAVFSTPPESMREVCDRYGEVFRGVDSSWQDAVAGAKQAGEPEPLRMGDPEVEQLRQVLYTAPAVLPQDADTSSTDSHKPAQLPSPCEVPVGPVVNTEFFFDSSTIDQLWKLQGEVDRWIVNASRPAPHTVALVDASTPSQPRVFRRGNPLSVGDEVPRQFLEVLSDDDRQPFRNGSGRLELAQHIIAADNPLTARVMVNRIWAAHFGTGLVPTTSDFGLRAEAPSHPELLDWLAANFVSSGWSLKQLQRWLVMSNTFQQSSRLVPSDADWAADWTADWERTHAVDPANRLLWRMTPRRLSFEEFRDSLLSVCGELDSTVGGRPSDLFKPPYPTRRTLYGLVDRQYLPATLRVFDFANPDLHVANRSETTVPGQALFFLNDPWMIDRARQLAALGSMEATEQSLTDRQRVERMMQRVLGRVPKAVEIEDALAFIASVEPIERPPVDSRKQDWKYGYGRVNEADGGVENFQPLPYFSGTGWQGSESYPDGALGWVQLTAEGGHPGNDREHAAVRRWTSPAATTLNVRGQIEHQPAEGDGIRWFVIHSRLGILAADQLHQATQVVDLEHVELHRNDTLDFVVDIGNVLNSDQFLWKVTLTEVAAKHQIADAEDNAGWDSQSHFTTASAIELDAWEQFAQVLLCSNEFLFVD